MAQQSMLPMTGAGIRALVGELDPTLLQQLKIPHIAMKIEDSRAASKTQHSQMNNKY